MMLQAAAAVVLFLSGWGTAQIGRGVPLEGQYMLLLWEGPEFQPDPSLAEQYGTWGRDVGQSGIPISGDELGPSSRMLGPTSFLAPSASSGSGAPGAYHLGGYFLVDAGEEEALTLAENHPHRSYGGWVEVVPVIVR